jgi:hypothetical protein
VALHPHQTKRKPAVVPSLFFIKELAQLPGNIFPIDLNIRCEKIAMAIYPAFNVICSLTSAHLVLRSENANANFFNCFKFRVEFGLFQDKKANLFLTQNVFGIWPVATNVVALHPHQTKRKSTAIPSWITQPPRNIFAIYKTRAAKRSPWGRSSF